MQENQPSNCKYASSSMEYRFLEGKLAMLLKSKANIVHKLCTMAKEFRTLEEFSVADECLISHEHELDADESSSENEFD